MHYSAFGNTGMTDFEMLFKKYAMDIKKKSIKDLRGKIKFREDYDQATERVFGRFDIL